MRATRRTSKLAFGLVLALGAAALGCAGGGDGEGRRGPFARFRKGPGEGRPDEELKRAIGWTDRAEQTAVRSVLPRGELVAFGTQARTARKPAEPSPHKDILVISGGGVYGAHPAGVLYGWTQAGTRPTFDVVTGISTGALVAVFAFIGPSVDCQLREAYTTITDDDVFKKHRFPRSLLSESLADNAPLVRLIARYATDERIAEIAAAHQAGRRLYVGTTDLDVRRGIFWDMGAIASEGTPQSRALFRKVLLASAAIPGFFPPVPIEVTVDGRRYVERHIDGGVSSSMFFAPPWVPPGERAALPLSWLHGSDLYVLVAGKMYPDPTPVKSRSLAIAGNAVSTVLFDQTRSDLHKLFLLSIVTGMNYNVSVIPKELQSPTESTSFKPAEMTVLFEAGAEWARNHGKWRDTPPGSEPGEGGRYRAGTVLTDNGNRGVIGGDENLIPAVPPKK
ncbi:patatin-like phospholipase family protein [Gemmata sp.]|uniref:patatin-like phospholipase family protein n=1 Tax=Gemmata sp. TaxID=1914242 RepID=UPI003F709D2E